MGFFFSRRTRGGSGIFSRRSRRNDESSRTASYDEEDTSDNSTSDANVAKRGTTPPAAIDAIGDLLPLRLRAIPEDNDSCIICSENYECGSAVVCSLPCGHMYHYDCISDWLGRNCTCPVCRYELPTDDPDFEQGREIRMKAHPIVNDCAKSKAAFTAVHNALAKRREAALKEGEENTKLNMVFRALRFHDELANIDCCFEHTQESRVCSSSVIDVGGH
jgi:hypothetical protein